jgi:hypothetical protein
MSNRQACMSFQHCAIVSSISASDVIATGFMTTLSVQLQYLNKCTMDTNVAVEKAPL